MKRGYTKTFYGNQISSKTRHFQVLMRVCFRKKEPRTIRISIKKGWFKCQTRPSQSVPNSDCPDKVLGKSKTFFGNILFLVTIQF